MSLIVLTKPWVCAGGCSAVTSFGGVLVLPAIAVLGSRFAGSDGAARPESGGVDSAVEGTLELTVGVVAVDLPVVAVAVSDVGPSAADAAVVVVCVVAVCVVAVGVAEQAASARTAAIRPARLAEVRR